MTAIEALDTLRQRGGIALVDAGDLVVRAPRGTITPDLRAELAAHKVELLRLLAPEQPAMTQAEHLLFVAQALQVFPGATLPEGAENRLDAFRALARPHYPDMAPADRLDRAFAALSEVICRLAERGDVIAEARARAVWFLLGELEQEWTTRR